MKFQSFFFKYFKDEWTQLIWNNIQFMIENGEYVINPKKGLSYYDVRNAVETVLQNQSENQHLGKVR